MIVVILVSPDILIQKFVAKIIKKERQIQFDCTGLNVLSQFIFYLKILFIYFDREFD